MARHLDAACKCARIVNDLGLHARSAAQLARLARKARNSIAVSKGEMIADATDVMDMLALECPKGTIIAVSIADAADAEILEEMVSLIENGFGEI